MYKLALYFLYFIMYSVMGWCLEMVYCGIGNSIKNKKLTIHNRGFLYGPLCPIYGTATVVMLLALSQFKDNILLLFLVGLVVCDVVEYLTSFLMEKLFHAHWWDYTGHFLNVNGRIDFVHSLEWGLLSVVFIRYIHPFFSSKVFWRFGEVQLEIVALLIFAYFVYDIICTVIATVNVKNLQVKLEHMKNVLTEKVEDSRFYPEELPTYMAEVRERFSSMSKGRRTRHILIEFPEFIQRMQDNMEEMKNAGNNLKEGVKENVKDGVKEEWEKVRQSMDEFLKKHHP